QTNPQADQNDVEGRILIVGGACDDPADRLLGVEDSEGFVEPQALTRQAWSIQRQMEQDDARRDQDNAARPGDEGTAQDTLPLQEHLPWRYRSVDCTSARPISARARRRGADAGRLRGRTVGSSRPVSEVFAAIDRCA